MAHPYSAQSTGQHAYPPHLEPANRAQQYSSSADRWGPPSSEDRSRLGQGPATTATGGRGMSEVSSSVPLVTGTRRGGPRDSAPWIDDAAAGSATSSQDDGQAKERHLAVDPRTDPGEIERRRKKWRWTALHRWQASFLVAILVQTLAVVALIGVIFGMVQAQVIDSNARLNSIRTYLAVFIVANVFQIVMAIDALSFKNTMQLMALVILNFLMTAYGAVLPGQVREALTRPDDTTPDAPPDCSESLTCFGVENLYGDVRGLLIAIPIIIGVCSCWMLGSTVRLYTENGWQIWKEIGADINLKKAYSRWQVFSVLNKFNFFFFLSFSIQLLILVSGVSTAEFVITIVAVPVVMLVIFSAAIGVRREIHWIMVIFSLIWVGALVYYFYKLVRILSHATRYEAASRSLALFAFLSIVTLLATGVFAALCWSNFGKGLKDEDVHSVLDWCLSRRKQGDAERRPQRMSLD